MRFTPSGILTALSFPVYFTSTPFLISNSILAPPSKYVYYTENSTECQSLGDTNFIIYVRLLFALAFSAGQCLLAVTGAGGQILRAAAAV